MTRRQARGWGLQIVGLNDAGVAPIAECVNDRRMTHAEIARIIAQVALLRGTFTLRSGRTSSYYLDKYLFSTRPEVLGPLAEMFAARIEGDHVGGEDALKFG